MDETRVQVMFSFYTIYNNAKRILHHLLKCLDKNKLNICLLSCIEEFVECIQDHKAWMLITSQKNIIYHFLKDDTNAFFHKFKE